MSAAREWIERVYADVPGALVVCHENAAGQFCGTGGQCGTHDEAGERIVDLDVAGARGVYLRVTTVARRLGAYERGGSADAHYLPGLWADVDYGTIGHRHDPDLHDGLVLPGDEDEARRIVDTSGLPAPSLWVHSGGGLYPWWLLDHAAHVTDDNRAILEDLSACWQEVIKSAANRLGYHYGAGVGDLARVLRVPGTINRKNGQERPCRVVEDTGQVYALDDLLAALPPAPRPPATPVVPVWEPVSSAGSVLDRFAAETKWGDLLARYGFIPCRQRRHAPNIAECFTRPGDPEHSCSAHVLVDNPHVLVVWSESAGLPTGKGRKLTKARVLAHMEHGDDLSAAAHALTGTTGAGSNHDDPAADDQAAGDQPATPPGATWQAVDLADVIAGLIAGTITRHTPSIGTRSDGAALFYPGKVNGIAGASGSGKTWTALATCAQQLAAGEAVVYVDLEDDAAGVVGRLLDVGADPEAIADRFAYVSPDESYGPFARLALETLVDQVAPTVVVIDSTGESMALDGAKPNDDDDTARWFRRLPTALARMGPAVIVLDHVVKADDGGLWPIGSQRKRAAINGAQYMQTTLRPFAKDAAGAAKLVCAKDRHGNYRPGQTVTHLAVTPDAPGVLVALEAPAQAVEAGDTFRPTGYMERVSRALALASEPVTFNGITERVTGKRQVIRTAVDMLIAEGYVTTEPGRNRSTLHTLAEPYTEADDGREPPGGQMSPDPVVGGSGSLDGEPGTTTPSGSGNHPGTTEEPPGSRTCRHCGKRLAALLIANGYDAHPTCAEAAS